MARILVAGAGCGGLVAAIKLAEMGHNVTVSEKCEKDLLGLEQTDAIDLSAFEATGIPVSPSVRFLISPIFSMLLTLLKKVNKAETTSFMQLLLPQFQVSSLMQN